MSPWCCKKHNDHHTNFIMNVIGKQQKVAKRLVKWTAYQFNLKIGKGGSLKNVSILDDHFSINMKLYRSFLLMLVVLTTPNFIPRRGWLYRRMKIQKTTLEQSEMLHINNLSLIAVRKHMNKHNVFHLKKYGSGFFGHWSLIHWEWCVSYSTVRDLCITGAFSWVLPSYVWSSKNLSLALRLLKRKINK